MIGTYLYRKILNKINLSDQEVLILKKKLTTNKVCSGPFIKNGKMCPVTTALSIKLKRKRFSGKKEIQESLDKIGVSRIRLWLFYLVFDLPSLISKRIFKRNLETLKKSVSPQ
jgi:hypothetical protein